MKKLLLLIITLTAPLLLFSFIRDVSGMNSEQYEINKLIITATTPQDHLKVADYYDKQAQEDEEKTRFYASIADSYTNRDKPLIGLAKYYTNLSNKYAELAQGYKNLSIEHKNMAEEMQNN
ncbi:MAG: hypothetical protein L0Y68_02905 [Candidatus Dadabacteria bacterium]|nr:hypothetical protein [Candidatus Dadabacteria bacterium]